jgi:hypothetical protein
MPNHTQISDVFGAVASAVKELSEDDLDAVASGKATLKIVVTKAPSTKLRKEASLKEPPRVPIDVEAILTALSTADTREDGARIVEEKSPNRVDLEALARRLSVPVMREDNKGTLLQKIVEATVGSRLRSVAIRNPSAA